MDNQQGGGVAGRLDREYQREILTKLAEAYPHPADATCAFGEVGSDFLVNVHYLHEHGLVSANIMQPISGGAVIGPVTITARGLDFMQDDGGLSAILGTITVRLHDDTIRALLIEKVEASSGDIAVKGKLVETIKGLPADALKKLAEKAMTAGIEHLPERIDQLRQWLTP